MKKFIVTLLAVFYLGASSGASVNIHYCMGKLIDWGISDGSSGDCGNCGMEKGNTENCCKDKEHKLTIKESLKASASTYLFSAPALAFPYADFKETGLIPINRLYGRPFFGDPLERTPATPVFIRNCSFRI